MAAGERQDLLFGKRESLKAIRHERCLQFIQSECHRISMIRLAQPILLLESRNGCYKCGSVEKVIALASQDFSEYLEDEEQWSEIEHVDDDLVIVHTIREMPPSLLSEIQNWHSHYEHRRSRTINERYWMNICSKCGAHFGDFYMHDEPGGSFFPMNEAEAEAMTIRTLEVNGMFEFDADFSMGGGDLILAHAKRL